MSHTWVRALSAAAAIATAAGGAYTITSPGPAPRPRPAPAVDLVTLTMPLDPYIDGAGNPAFVTATAATAAAANRCLARYGIPPISATIAPPPYPGYTRAWGITSAGEAALFGYHQPPTPPTAKLAPGQLATEPAGPEPEPPHEVMLGTGSHRYRGRDVPAGGCYGQATRQLLAGVDTGALDTGRDLVIRAAHTADTSRAVKAANAAWAGCMTRAGFGGYRDPWAANDAPAFATPQPSRQEIATAVTDVRCKTATGYTAARAAAARAHQTRVITQNPAQFAAVRAAYRQRAANAARMLAG